MVSAKGRAYQAETCAAVFEQLRQRPHTLVGPVSVIVTLYPPDRRRRDLDNFNKALFDALTRAGIWQDDSQIKRLLLEWGPIIPKGQVVVAISTFGAGS
ncbi:Crossover junction endodeoxyribonuclease rusA [Pluralibacter gergoviae]|nr:Crossover junction endodeoxyribonuclease rusA [Pluralibacter gergoviae]